VNETVGEVAGPPAHVRVDQPGDLRAALQDLNVAVHRPVLVCVGGAGGMTPDDLAVTATALQRVIPTLEEWQAAVVDGGTDSGVMKVTGRLREAAQGHFPLIGVAAEGTVIFPGSSARPDAAALEPHHTHVILVPGQAWGDESPWLSAVATAIADGQPSLTLVINGGQITYDDIDHSLRASRPVLVLDGTGRTADAIAAAARGEAADPKAAKVAAAAGTRVVSCRDPGALRAAIESILARRLSTAPGHRLAISVDYPRTRRQMWRSVGGRLRKP
jgi:hypothetical protein